MTNRQEVAKKLRGSGEWLFGYSYNAAAVKAIGILRDATDSTYNYATLLDCLADLIDPTCRIVYIDESWSSPDVGHIDEWHYECSRCCYELNDEEMDEFEGGVLPFRYCPGCGSRVVRGNHD